MPNQPNTLVPRAIENSTEALGCDPLEMSPLQTTVSLLHPCHCSKVETPDQSPKGWGTAGPGTSHIPYI